MSADRPTIANEGSSNVTSISMNFFSNRVAIGYPTYDSNTGRVKIYDYSFASNTWTNAKTIDGPSTEAFFGQSLDMDWDGACLVVGANAVSNVYVYNYDGTNWQNYSNIITCPSGTGAEFGYCVSISKDTPDAIAIGSPAHNNVYVYELTNSVWTESFRSNGADIENRVSNTPASGDHYIVIPSLNNYGFSARLSSFGNNLIIGQPGTVLAELDSTNLLYSNSQPYTGSSINVEVLHTGLNENRQEGSVRVYKTDTTWISSNAQVGTVNLTPTINSYLNDASRTAVFTGWSFPAYGMTCDISTDGGLIVIAAPLYSVVGGDYSYYHGQLYTYELNPLTEEWDEKNVFTGLKKIKLGSTMKLDYTGSRIALGGSNKDYSLLNISDWNGTNWFNVKPDIVTFKTVKSYDETVYTTDGKIAFISGNGVITPYTYLLTQTVLGNTLFSGYLAANEIFVGSNSNDLTVSDPESHTKKISFGGTYLDNAYEGATIENRLYQTVAELDTQANEGRSEFFISKTSEAVGISSSGAVDFVRIKANEIHLDSHPIYQGDKYEQSPLLVLNYQKNVSIGLPFEIGGGGAAFRGTSDAKAKLDVNGDMYIRNRVNINVDKSNDLVGSIGEMPNILFDTRNASTCNVSTGELFSNIMYDQLLTDNIGYLEGSAIYDITERSIDLSSGGYINVGGYSVHADTQRIKLSYWFKLKSLPGTTIQLSRYGNIDEVAENVTISITSTGFIVDYLDAHVETYTFTFEVDKWYHILLRFPGTTATTTDRGVPIFYVNDVDLTVASETGTAPVTYLFSVPATLDIGPTSGLLPGYVGMIMLWTQYESSRGNPDTSAMFNNGSPTEMLKVGGDAAVTGRLDVSGNTYVTGNTFVSGTLGVTGNTFVSGTLAVLDDAFVSGSLGVTGEINVTGNVGIGTGSPTNGKLHVVGSGSNSATSYGYLNSSGSTGTDTANVSYSVWADGRIAAIEFNAHSDVRIKKEIENVNNSSALETFRLLQPKTYKYIDEKIRGSNTVYGFIAQEVLEVLPYAVTLSGGDIPNILSISNVYPIGRSAGIELHLETPTDIILSNTSVLNITTSDDRRIKSNVQSIDSTGTIITVDYSAELSNVYGAYIHGESIHDFHHLNKDSIWTLATAALKEVDMKVVTLETQLISVLDRLEALERFTSSLRP
jgi:hypothetical protein